MKLDDSCNNEKNFIKNLRIKISNNTFLINNYTNLFNHMVTNFKSSNFKYTFKQILKDMGSIRNVLKQFAKENKFTPKYLNEFLENIKMDIQKNKTYVGQIEVETISMLLKDCKISIYIFTDYKIVSKIIEKHSDNKNSIYIILDQEGEHYEYIHNEE